MIATQEQPAVRDNWLAERPSFIGSSDSPAILGYGYTNPETGVKENAHTVWLRKIGLADEQEDNDKLLCGRMLQNGICQIIAYKTGYDIRPADEYQVVRSKEHPWLAATPDSYIYGDPRGLGVCELKNVDHYLLRDWKGDQPPLRVAIQLQHQLVACGATWGITGAIIGGNRPVWFELSLHTRLVSAMIPALANFWSHVESRTPPPVDASSGCTEAIKALYPQDNGLTVPMPPDACRWFDELTALKRADKFLKERRTLIENRIKSALGEATEGQLPDGRRFTWKTQSRAGYTVEPGQCRVLRQHGEQGDNPELPEHRIAVCTRRLIELGAVLLEESDSGSRYFELPGGLRVRLADHEPNEKTAAWMERREVASIRVDLDTWSDDLQGICGPCPDEREGD